MDTFECALCSQICFEFNNFKGNDICENCRKKHCVNENKEELMIELKEVLKQYSNIMRNELHKMIEIRKSFAK